MPALRTSHEVEGPHICSGLRPASQGVFSLFFRRELQAGPIETYAGMGSFDCAAVREANGGFAQDDNLELNYGR